MNNYLFAVAALCIGYNMLWLIIGSNANTFRDYGDVAWMDRLHNRIKNRLLARWCWLIGGVCLIAWFFTLPVPG